MKEFVTPGQPSPLVGSVNAFKEFQMLRIRPRHLNTRVFFFLVNDKNDD